MERNDEIFFIKESFRNHCFSSQCAIMPQKNFIQYNKFLSRPSPLRKKNTFYKICILRNVKKSTLRKYIRKTAMKNPYFFIRPHNCLLKIISAYENKAYIILYLFISAFYFK